MQSIDILKCKLVREAKIPYQEITSPSDAASVFRAMGLADAADEVLVIACLAADGTITGVHEVSHGDLTGSVITPREVFKRAILNNAAAIVLGHNHPSGNLQPSSADIQATGRLQKAGNLLGIPVRDHIILSMRGHLSFSQEGLL